MIKFAIHNRWSCAVQFEAEIEANEDTPLSIKIGLAVKWAVKARAYLADAYLADANLADAYLAGAYLAGANLAGAYLAGANLADAYLAGANLAGANLAGANLAGAYLAGANLAGANLAGANLAGANLAGAYLADAYLADAKWRDGIVIAKPPIQIFGLLYRVTILDQHMQIGCELHSLAEWDAFDDRRIATMDGVRASHFWRDHKTGLMAIARGAGRSTEAPAEDEQPAAAAE